MTTCRDRIMCPWCGTQKRRRFFDEFSRLTDFEYPASHVTTACDACGRRFEVRVKTHLVYSTRKVTA